MSQPTFKIVSVYVLSDSEEAWDEADAEIRREYPHAISIATTGSEWWGVTPNRAARRCEDAAVVHAAAVKALDDEDPETPPTNPGWLAQEADYIVGVLERRRLK